jgi:hypothetical protein
MFLMKLGCAQIERSQRYYMKQSFYPRAVARGLVRGVRKGASTVGVIVNPASGKDIRRVIAAGTVVTNQGATWDIPSFRGRGRAVAEPALSPFNQPGRH